MDYALADLLNGSIWPIEKFFHLIEAVQLLGPFLQLTDQLI
jgi:hypothetical protein